MSTRGSDEERRLPTVYEYLPSAYVVMSAILTVWFLLVHKYLSRVCVYCVCVFSCRSLRKSELLAYCEVVQWSVSHVWLCPLTQRTMFQPWHMSV